MALRLPTTSTSLSLRGKILLAFTLLTALLTLLVGSIYVINVTRTDRAHITDKLHLAADHLSELVRLPLYAEDLTRLTEISSRVVTQPEMRSITISAADGRTLIELHTSELNTSGSGIAASTIVMSGSSSSSAEEAIAGGAAPRYQIGTLTLVRNTSDLDRQLILLTQKTILTSLLIWTLVTAVFWLILRRHTSSYSELMRGIRRLQQHDYTTTITTLSDNEAGAAAVALNDLGLRLQEKMRENERLTSDLRDQNLHLTTLLGVIPAGVCQLDSSGNVIFLNDFFCETFGYENNEAPDFKSLLAILLPDDNRRTKLLRDLEPAAGEEQRERFVLAQAELTCKSGVAKRCVIKKAIEPGGSAILTFTDVTELELLREEAARSQKLESIGILAGGVAHNFNNALTGILGYISLANKKLDNSNPTVSIQLDKAAIATRRAASMATQLLNFARGHVINRLPVTMAFPLTEAVSEAITDNRIHVQFHIPENLPTIFADGYQLHQVFSNLALNAAQAMPNGGTLTITAQHVPTSGLPGHGPAISVTIADTGHGINASDLERIFDPYFTTKKTVTNSGLGLATVQSIVHHHGGLISVESCPGKGTTFTVTLPVAHQESCTIPENNPEVPQPATNGNGRAILVMDDEETILDIAANMLSSLGYCPTTCFSGEDAVRLYRQALETGPSFVMAILDLSVPGGMGGKEAARQILEIDSQACLVVSSGHLGENGGLDYKQYGFRGSLPKPYYAKELEHLLGKLLTP